MLMAGRWLISAQDAISAVWRDRASVVATWGDAYFRSPSITIPVPRVLMLREYAADSGEPKFCRRSILLRDRFQCQYCGDRFRRTNAPMITWSRASPRVETP
jgi:5-methylcytosine-specific restriction endonuclease McrA